MRCGSKGHRGDFQSKFTPASTSLWRTTALTRTSVARIFIRIFLTVTVYSYADVVLESSAYHLRTTNAAPCRALTHCSLYSGHLQVVIRLHLFLTDCQKLFIVFSSSKFVSWVKEKKKRLVVESLPQLSTHFWWNLASTSWSKCKISHLISPPFDLLMSILTLDPIFLLAEVNMLF